MDFRNDFSEESGTLTVFLFKEIDHHSAKGLREETDKALFKFKPDSLVLDFSEVRFMDSSGIAFIIGRSEIAKDLGISVRLTGLSKTLLRLVRLSGIEKIKNISII